MGFISWYILYAYQKNKYDFKQTFYIKSSYFLVVPDAISDNKAFQKHKGKLFLSHALDNVFKWAVW